MRSTTYTKLLLSAIAILLSTALSAASAKRLTLANLDDVRRQVWSQWQNAVNAQAHLPAVGNFSTNIVLWQIPDALEPDAEWAFCYGAVGPVTPGEAPLMIYLHGSGPADREWHNGVKFAESWGKIAPSVYAVPRIPNEGEWYRWWQQSKQWAYENMLCNVLAGGEIHPDSIYMLGISEGGYGAQRLASFYADYLAAAGPMAGGEPLRNAPAENLRNLPLSLLTGDRDNGFYRNRLTARTARALDSLAAGSPGEFPHRVELLEGYGHGIPYDLTPTWLKQFSRNSHPHHVTWEDYAMDGRHRSGFYNLLVENRPDLPDTVRVVYDLTIAGQFVELTVQKVTYTTTVTDPVWGIALDFDKTFSPVEGGKVTIFFDEQLIDLKRPVVVRLNGVTMFSGILPLSRENLERSCRAYFDPRRLYPASVTLTY